MVVKQHWINLLYLQRHFALLKIIDMHTHSHSHVFPLLNGCPYCLWKNVAIPWKNVAVPRNHLCWTASSGDGILGPSESAQNFQSQLGVRVQDLLLLSWRIHEWHSWYSWDQSIGREWLTMSRSSGGGCPWSAWASKNLQVPLRCQQPLVLVLMTQRGSPWIARVITKFSNSTRGCRNCSYSSGKVMQGVHTNMCLLTIFHISLEPRNCHSQYLRHKCVQGPPEPLEIF